MSLSEVGIRVVPDLEKRKAAAAAAASRVEEKTETSEAQAEIRGWRR